MSSVDIRAAKQTGFHGDLHLQRVVSKLFEYGKIRNFVETGSAYGNTLEYIAKLYPDVSCWSCELHNKRFRAAKERCEVYPNVQLFQESSQEFIKRQEEMRDVPTLFWLDAHGRGFEWPLLEEIEFITNHFTHCYILIDDFKIPDAPWFGFDEYNGQKCEHEYIKDQIAWSDYELWYPTYKEHTSAFHPLRGWGLYAHGLPTDSISTNIARRGK